MRASPCELGAVTLLEMACERLVHGSKIGEVVQPLAALLQLSRRLPTAQHQHGKQSSFSVIEPKRLVEQMAIFAGATAGAAGKPCPATQSEPPQRLDHGLLVVVDHRIPVG